MPKRKTDTRRIIHYMFESVSGERIPRYEDVDRLKEAFTLHYWITSEEDIMDAWEKAIDTMEEIYEQSKGNLTEKSIEEVFEAMKEAINMYLEWEGLPQKYYKINEEMYEKALDKFGIKRMRSPLE